MTEPVWVVATGPEARSVRRWAARILPGRVLRAAIALVGVGLFVVASGRLYLAGYEVDAITCLTECVPNEGPHPRDIWDAIF